MTALWWFLALGLFLVFALWLSNRRNAQPKEVSVPERVRAVASSQAPAAQPASSLPSDDGEWIGVVGESRYRDNLYAIFGRNEDGIEDMCQAVLVREANNAFDTNAVRVDIEGKTVGYIPREIAPQVHAVLQDGRLEVLAHVRGGFKRDDSSRGGGWADFGVEVCVPAPK